MKKIIFSTLLLVGLFHSFVQAQLISLISGNIPGCIGSSVTLQFISGGVALNTDWRINGVHVTTAYSFTTNITSPQKEVEAYWVSGPNSDSRWLTPLPNPANAGTITGLT